MSKAMKRMRGVGLTLALACGLLATPPFLLAQLPRDIQADLLTVEAERQLEAGNHSAAVAKFDELLKLREEHDLETPPEFWFKRAQALREAGHFGKAAESAERYVLEAGREGEHYWAALELLAAMPSAGDVFQDCTNCPEMVLIPSGTFRMGCLSGDDDCYGDELPVHEVSIQSFALSKHEVTFAQWDTCVAAGSCGGYSPIDQDWGRGNRPVISVSWEDAKSFIAWWSEVTGHAYRLPTESEWEYAARAGSVTKYHFGNAESQLCRYANHADRDSIWDWRNKACSDPHFGETSPVGRYEPNQFGLYDMLGNVWEWVEDCWKDSYAGPPSDGSAWLGGNCDERVLRGGSWRADPRNVRSANRFKYNSGARYFNEFGFRVARTLTP